MKKAHFTKLAIMATIFFTACSHETVIRTNTLPAGVEIKDFKQEYYPVKGIHEVSFTLANNTGKTIKIPSVQAAFYKDGILKGDPAGGCSYPLNTGESCSSKVSWLLPSSSADSVVFTYNGF